ncbi:MAG: hypothetical protein WBZ33_11665, partial [Thermoactinomyces sp.]
WKPEAGLTAKGKKQAGWLADFFLPLQVDRIISSPYVRAFGQRRFRKGWQLSGMPGCRRESSAPTPGKTGLIACVKRLLILIYASKAANQVAWR